MARLTFAENVTAGALFSPLVGWQYEYAPFGGIVKFNFDATAVGVVITVSAGSDTLQQRSPVASGGVVGVMPSDFDQEPLTDEVAAGDRLIIQFENTTVGAIDVQGYALYTPA